MSNRKVKKKFHKTDQKPLFQRRWFWIILLFLGAVLVFIGLLMYDDFYQLKEVEVKDLSKTSPYSLQALVKEEVNKKALKTSSLIFTPTKPIKKSIIQSYPHIRDVEVKKQFPGKLEINVKEREPKLVWCQKKDCYYVDQNGIIFQKVKEPEDELVVEVALSQQLEFGKRAFKSDDINFIFELKEALEKDFTITKMHIPHKYGLFVKIAAGPELRFYFKDNLEDQVERLKILIDTKIEELSKVQYIELRYGNRIYYKPEE